MIGWLDAGSGASGDMLLGALLDAGVNHQQITGAVTAVAPQSISLSAERVNRASLTALRARVAIGESMTHRGLSDVLALIADADLDAAVAEHASAVFRRLGEVEAEVHGVHADQIEFHEVGALDAIADIVGVCTGFVALGLEELHCSAVAVGSGTVQTRHGTLTVPPPAVALLLRGVATYAGPAPTELCTPTGAALLTHWVTHWGAQPLMEVQQIGTGAGGKEFSTHPNVLRLLLGRRTTGTYAGITSSDPTTSPDQDTPPATAVVYESNVDDLDPRLWPSTLQRLLDAGASDAWLTPILMKKGRPAYTLSVLLRAEHAIAVQRVLFKETSAIGLREFGVTKQALNRQFTRIEVGGHGVNIKVARLDGEVVNVQPEYEDVATAAHALDQPIKSVMAAATAAAAHLWERG